MIDLRVPESVAREWLAHVRAGLPLSERAKQETVAAVKHALAECGCGKGGR